MAGNTTRSPESVRAATRRFAPPRCTNVQMAFMLRCNPWAGAVETGAPFTAPHTRWKQPNASMMSPDAVLCLDLSGANQIGDGDTIHFFKNRQVACWDV